MWKLKRFSLRTLFVLVLAIALVLGMVIVPGLRQSHYASMLLNSGARIEYGRPAAPSWIVDLIGHDFFQPITRVAFVIERHEGPASSPEKMPRIVESPETLMPILRQLHSLKQITVSAAHHDAIIDRMDRELPGVKVLSITLPPGTVGNTWIEKPQGTLRGFAGVDE